MLEKILKGICCFGMLILLLGCVMAVTGEPQAAAPAAYALPRLNLEGKVLGMWDKADVREISVEYQDASGSFTAYAQLKLQGASSLEYDKKNYNIKFFTDQDCNSKKQVDLGWGPQSKYCLKANWIDKTHARNLVSARLAAEIQAKYDVLPQAPNYGLVDGFPVEVYAGGEFLGLYTLNIPKDEWLLGMDKDNKDHLAFMSFDWNDASTFDALPSYDTWEIFAGDKNEENLQKLSRLFTFVLESSDEEFREQYADYFDLDAAMNYAILCDFGLMVDNSGKNMILATYDGRVWYPSLYDMDESWGSDWSGRELYDYELPSVVYVNYFLKRVRDVFSEELLQRYFELREEILTKEHVMALFDDFRSTIPEEVWEREQARWRDIPGFDYDQIEAFLDAHIPQLDAYMQAKLDRK